MSSLSEVNEKWDTSSSEEWAVSSKSILFLLYAGSSSSLVNPEGVLNFIEISHFSLTSDNEEKIILNDKNSFLHDNVD